MPVITIVISEVAAVLTRFAGHTWYDAVSYGLVVPVLAFVPSAIHRQTPRLSPRWRTMMEWLAFALLAITAPATVKLHAMGFQYDRFLHFAAAFLSLFVAVGILTAYRPEFVRRGSRLVGAAALFMVAALFVWEGHQYTADRIFGTRLFYDSQQSMKRDFWEDIGFGMLGIIGGLCVLVPRRGQLAELTLPPIS